MAPCVSTAHLGRLCESRVQVCHLRPCLNGATCLDSAFGFVCFCRPGFSGYQCETVLATQGGSDIMPVHNVGQPLPKVCLCLSFLGGGGNTEAQSQEQRVQDLRTTATVQFSLDSPSPKEDRAQKTQNPAPRRGRRRRPTTLHRSPASDRQQPGDDGDEDKYPNIVHLHRQLSTPTTVTRTFLVLHAGWMTPNLAQISTRCREAARARDKGT
ncbi:hypothetical protein C0Q70_09585 [Pomacea canaliculata]|uniref:EGF-like domain-containing protein n=1 Tax=Pomacea canaliculata TaxID=400727 RepID=A0A2T7PA88_POMCA|nr:hypothetical protein C0Q70_09585 [Pomacea canaliculata]